MGRAEISASIAAPPDRVWQYVRWENAEALERGGFCARVEYGDRTARPGAERTLFAAEGPPVRERLEEVTPSAFRYVYRLVDPGPMPVRDYVGEVRIDPEGPSGSRITVRSTFEPCGVSEAEWIERYTELETALFEWLRAQVESPDALDDRNVSAVTALETPRAVRARLPLDARAAGVVRAARAAIRDVLHGRDDRLVMVVGPCSIHDPAAARAYAERLAEAAAAESDALVVVMRAYFEKPRTTVGWKGMINDPHLDGSCDVATGLERARRVLLELAALGVPSGSELLDPITPQYVADLVAWSSIGARTTESQTHREMASGLSMPVGFKNATDGNVQVAADAMTSARHPHTFVGIDVDGVTCTIRTRGNPDRHVILRGGRGGTNYDAQQVAAAAELVAGENIARPVMVDCSHGNSQKDPRNQLAAGREVLAHVRRAGAGPLMGLLLESHLVEGRQDWAPGKTLTYGQSITDACLGWEDTAVLLREAADAVRATRR